MQTKNMDKVTPQLPEDLGQKTMAYSVSTVLASDYVIPVTLTLDKDTGVVEADTMRVTIATDDAVMISIAGTLTSIDTYAQSMDGTLASIDAHQAAIETVVGAIEVATEAIQASVAGTLDVSVSASALPTGAATEATLAAASAKLPASLGTKAKAASLAVTLASDENPINAQQSGTWTVEVSDSVLPDGAATEATLASVAASVGSLSASAATESTLGSVDLNVQTLVARTSHAKVALFTNDHSSVSVTTAAYVQLTASTSADIRKFHIFDSSGSMLVLATGAAASEVDQFYIPPGGIDIEIDVASGTRLSVKAVDANTSAGRLLITALS